MAEEAGAETEQLTIRIKDGVSAIEYLSAASETLTGPADKVPASWIMVIVTHWPRLRLFRCRRW